MGDLRRWNVTYTKHVKQKRKVYQDGFLEFDGSINKVMLYDECEKLLDNRPLKKDEVVESGGTLAFDAYLVDIGDLEGGLKPIIKLEIEEKEKKTTKMTEIHQGQKTRNNPTFVGKGASKSCQSPSGNLIREYRKSALRKYGAVKVLPDITKTTFTGNNGLQSLEETQNCSNAVQTTVKEWNVLYTTQITKKAKKYHDGILRLLLCGSRGRQVCPHYLKAFTIGCLFSVQASSHQCAVTLPAANLYVGIYLPACNSFSSMYFHKNLLVRNKMYCMV